MAADPSRYRVELIVLNHLEHAEQPRKEQRLEDYSGALDFLTLPNDAAGGGEGAAAESAPGTAAEAGEMAVGDAAPDAESAPRNAVVHVPELSAQMQEVWRRLRLSEPFRPLQQLAWEQDGDAPFPTLRVHDLEVVLTESPLAANPALLAEPQAAAAQDQVLADGAEVPPPIRYYRLDGTASLTRSRFLHLSIAVELREPVYARDTAAIAAPGSGPDLLAEPLTTSFLVHRLEQSRVVRTGRIEYFDGPVLGVLAWVTDISDTVTEERAE